MRLQGRIELATCSPVYLQSMSYSVDQYQQRALSTARYPGVGSNPLYPIFGLAGETGEMLEKINEYAPEGEVAKEGGDACWYLATLAHEMGLTLSDLLQVTEWDELHKAPSPDLYGRHSSIALAASYSRLCEHGKKMMRDDEGQLTDKRRTVILQELRTKFIPLFADHVVAYTGRGLGELADANIEKLSGRAERGTLHGDGDNR